MTTMMQQSFRCIFAAAHAIHDDADGVEFGALNDLNADDDAMGKLLFHDVVVKDVCCHVV